MIKLLTVLLLISSTAFADSSSRYEKIADKVNDQIWGASYKLNVNHSVYLASANKTRLTFVQTEFTYCNIEYNPQRFANLSDDAVAWVFGHELAHCNNNDNGYMIGEMSEDREYKADSLGLTLMTKAGYSFDRVLADTNFLSYIDLPSTDTHPAWKNRVVHLGFKLAKKG